MILEDARKFGNIIIKYRKWLSNNDLKDEPESLLAFLYIEGYLKEVENVSNNKN